MPLMDRLRIAPQIEEDIEYELPPDPTPGDPPPVKSKRPATRRATSPTTTPTVTKMAKDVAADLTTLIEMTAAAWSMADECCAPVLEAQAKPIADAITNILKRNPRLLAKFAQADTAIFVMQAAALGKALAPVGKAIYRNHMTEQEGADGAHGPSLDSYPAYNGSAA